MAANRNEIHVRSLDSESFRQYGQLISIRRASDMKPDFESENITFYGALGIFESRTPMEFGICTYKKREPVIEHLEQHVLTQELLYAIDDDFIMPVAPNVTRGVRNVPDLDNLEAVEVRKGEGILFDKGIWHWIPYPRRNHSYALVGFSKDTAKNDIEVFDLDEVIHILE